MQKFLHNRLWAFDSEWVPDPLAGRLVHGLDEGVQDPREVLQIMWGEGGATEDDPTPFLKMVLCRVVSIAAVERLETDGEVVVRLMALPRDPADASQASEAQVLGTSGPEETAGALEGSTPLRRRLVEAITEDPETAAMVVRNWMNDAPATK